jgi:hypothetical protein
VAADDERTLARPAALPGDARLFLRRQRAADQRLHQRLRERGRDTERLRIAPRLQQHFTFAPVVARRLPGRAFHRGDLAAERLALGDETEELEVDDVETGAEFFEGFHAASGGV